MSTTDTTTTTGLRLARFRTEQDARGHLPSGRGQDYSTEDSRTFFVDDNYDAYKVTGISGTYTTVIVPTSDPRHSGMWEAMGDHEGSHGWNVPRDQLEYLDTPTPPTDPEEPCPVGSRWTHPHVGEGRRVFVVTGPPQGNHYPVAFEDTGEACPGSPFVQGAMTTVGTRLPDAPAEESYIPQVGDVVEIVKTLVPSYWDRYAGMVGEVTRFDSSDNSWLVNCGDEGAVWSTELRKVEGGAATLASPAVRRAISAAVAEERARLTRTFEAWKEEATRVAHEYANNNSLCSEFDRCMADIGLRGRERRWTVEGAFTMIIDATSADEARAEAERLLEDHVYSVDATEAEIG